MFEIMTINLKKKRRKRRGKENTIKRQEEKTGKSVKNEAKLRSGERRKKERKMRQSTSIYLVASPKPLEAPLQKTRKKKETTLFYLHRENRATSSPRT